MRKEKLALRDSLTEEDLHEKSNIIKEKLLQLEEIEKAHNVFIYVSFRSEVETQSLINELLERGKVVSVPISYIEEKRMDAIRIHALSEDLTPGYCGILEPKKDLLVKNRISPEIIDVVIVPGSVFDERGGRFGYGGGYYDRFLEKLPFTTRIGLAFEIQTVKEAPVQSHDELLDYIITEERIIKSNR